MTQLLKQNIVTKNIQDPNWTKKSNFQHAESTSFNTRKIFTWARNAFSTSRLLNAQHKTNKQSTTFASVRPGFTTSVAQWCLGLVLRRVCCAISSHPKGLPSISREGVTVNVAWALETQAKLSTFGCRVFSSVFGPFVYHFCLSGEMFQCVLWVILTIIFSLSTELYLTMKLIYQTLSKSSSALRCVYWTQLLSCSRFIVSHTWDCITSSNAQTARWK